MRQRAKKSYGIKSFRENANLLTDEKSESEIKFLWQWLESSFLIKLNFFLTFIWKHLAKLKIAILKNFPESSQYWQVSLKIWIRDYFENFLKPNRRKI